MRKLIIVSGGDGRFSKILKQKNIKLNLKFLSKKQLNILSLNSIDKCFLKYKPDFYLLSEK